MRVNTKRIDRGLYRILPCAALLGVWLPPAWSAAQFVAGDPSSCLTEVQPVDGLAAAARIVQCTQGSFHPDGLSRPGDPVFFDVAQTGQPLWNDYLNAFNGGTSPIVPPDVDLVENFSGATTMALADSVTTNTSTQIVVENQGSTLLFPAVNPALSTAGAGWASYTTVEVIPFHAAGSSGALPIAIDAEFAGRFFGTGGSGELLNSQLQYDLTVRTRNAETGQLVDRGTLTGIVGFDALGDVYSDGSVEKLKVTLAPDGKADALAFLLPLEFDFLPEEEQSLVVTTGFSGFGSFAHDVGLALADGSELSVARISSADGNVRFRHSSELVELLVGDTAPLDGAVNIDDLNAVRNHFGTGNGGDVSGIPGDTLPFDGLVNVDDLNAVRNQFGAGTAPIPEPSTWTLIVLAIASLICRRATRR